MPCEACNAQFTVFRRKKSCTECRRLYCNQCLVKRREMILCDRCVVFTTRPLSKVELLKLKPKDLIFYLQSKHVSTTGCVEKEELVNLVIIHMSNTNGFSPAHSSGSSRSHSHAENDENFTNPFDQIKQTCQNLFSSFTDKIASDLNIDLRQTTVNGQNQNIFSQPRANSRNNSTPSDLSNAASQFTAPVAAVTTSSSSSSPPPPGQSPGPYHPSTQNIRSKNANQTTNTSPTSPVYSINSNSSGVTSVSSSSSGPSGLSSIRRPAASAPNDARNRSSNIPSVHIGSNRVKLKNKQIKEIDLHESTCDCSDDEMINMFHNDYNKKCGNSMVSTQSNRNDNLEAGPSGSSMNKHRHDLSDTSNASSFEELGAVGGGGGVSGSGNGNGDARGGCSNGIGANGLLSDTDNWQIVSKKGTFDDSVASVNLDRIAKSSESRELNNRSQLNLTDVTFYDVHSNRNGEQDENDEAGGSVLCQQQQQQQQRRLSRRRSDSYISSNATQNQNRVSHRNDDSDAMLESLRRRTKTSCNKCGKGRGGNLKRHVAKFRQQLENANTSEVEIKEKLEAFLQYLENLNSNSIEHESDTDSVNDDGLMTVPIENDLELLNENDNNGDYGDIVVGDDAAANDDDDDDDGIHVYAFDVNTALQNPFRLSDYEASLQLNGMSVKELKHLLMMHRVDYTGCCEKTELVDRVRRLWKDKGACPPADKLPTDDLCKICMDAPIECVILECGHMATCTNCGKVLSECPICRQYIVRVVRFFRA